MNFTRTAACYVFVRTERKDCGICDHKNNVTDTRQFDAGNLSDCNEPAMFVTCTFL
jgi:hypothetical protein